MKLQLSQNVDRMVGRVSGQFELEESDLNQLAYEGQAVLVMIVKVDELSVKSNARTGARTLMQVLTPVEARVASNGIKEQILQTLGSQDQLELDLAGPSEEDFLPPPELFEDEHVDEHVEYAPINVPAEQPAFEPDEFAHPQVSDNVARFKPEPSRAEDPVESPRVVGHIRGRERKDKVLARFLEGA